MKRALLIVTVLFIAVISTACINNFAVQELNNKAKMYLDKGDYESAINRLEASIDLDNTIFETNYNLGIAYIQAKNYKKAVDILNRAAKLKPDFADVYYSLGVANEGYAEELLELNEASQNVKQKLDEDYDEDEVKFIPNAEDKTLTPDERKEKAVELFDSAVVSFETYLKKSTNAKDSEDVNSQIKDIKEKINDLGKNN